MVPDLFELMLTKYGGEVSEAVWPLKVRFESSVTPRSLAAATGTRS